MDKETSVNENDSHYQLRNIMAHEAGKGSKQRPTNKQAFDEAFDRIFGQRIKEQKLSVDDMYIDKEWDQMKPVGLELPEYELNKSTGEVQPTTIVLKPDMED